MLVQKLRSRQGHREVRLAGSRGPDRKNVIVLHDGLDEATLVEVARNDKPLEGIRNRRVEEELDQIDVQVLLQHTDAGAELLLADRIPLPQQAIERQQKPSHQLFALRVTMDGELVAASIQRDPQSLLQISQVLVLHTEETLG